MAEKAEKKAKILAELMAESMAESMAEKKAEMLVKASITERINKANEKTALKLFDRGTSIEDIADILEASSDQVKQWLYPTMA